MIDLEALRRICGEYQCQVDVEHIGTPEKKLYMVVLKCPHRDYSKITELEKKIRETWPEVDRIVLDITPPKH
jgi:hypothetical protein